jgi:hypothetical protein
LNGLSVDDLRLVLEEDGTEVDQDYIPFMEPNTVLMLLSKDEFWNNKEGI